ncbi:hypothetical protein [Achromobacter xylosoxidans]|nr:hypothetical protein [Achromobacter xylosoxidans]
MAGAIEIFRKTLVAGSDAARQTAAMEAAEPAGMARGARRRAEAGQ